MKKMRLHLKLNLYILSVVFAGLAIILAIIAVQTAEKSRADAQKYVELRANDMATELENYLDKAAESTNTLVDNFLAMKVSKAGSRKLGLEAMRQILDRHKSYYAVWTMWEPNAFLGDDNRYKAIYDTEYGMYNASVYRADEQLFTQNFGTETQPMILFTDNFDEYGEDFYAIPKQTMKQEIMPPYFYSFTDNVDDEEFMTSIVSPVVLDGQFLGVVGTDISLAILKKLNDQFKLYNTGFSSVITNNGIIAMHPDSSFMEKSVSEVWETQAELINETITTGQVSMHHAHSKYLNKKVLRVFVPIEIGGTETPWSVMVEVPVDEILADSRRLVSYIAFFGILALLVIGVVVFYISKNITRPIIKSAILLEQIADGSLNVEFKYESRNDELGVMSLATSRMLTKLQEIIRKISESSANTTTAVKEINVTAQEIAQGANEQASSAEEVSAAIQQILVSIENNKNHAYEAEKIAKIAEESIVQGSSASQESVASMERIAEDIGIINEIADKTDLLAINASIEAARAGEFGRGFAVVAYEIRKLAVKSQQSASRIQELVSKSLSNSIKSGEILADAVPKVQNTSQIVQEIAVASREQNQGAQQIAQAIEQLNSVTQSNAASAEELATGSEELETQAEQLSATVAFFKLK